MVKQKSVILPTDVGNELNERLNELYPAWANFEPYIEAFDGRAPGRR